MTEMAAQAINDARESALKRNHPEIQVEHILYALTAQKEGIVPQLLFQCAIEPGKLLGLADNLLKRKPSVQGEATLALSRSAQKAVQKAFDLAQEMGDGFVSTEILFLGILETAESDLKEIFLGLGLTSRKIREEIGTLRKGRKVDSPTPENQMKALERFSVDFTELARKRKLDPVIGRDAEIRRGIQVLMRRTKNNPVLIGEPGVGKTAIVEGLAQRMVDEDVPEGLRNKRLVG